MIPASRLLIDFDEKFDRFSNESNRRLRIEDKDSIINEALEIYFENKVAKAETDSKVRQELRPLEEKEIKLVKLEDGDTFSIFKIPKNSYKILRARAIVEKEGCGQKEIPLIMFQTDDLNNGRKSPYWKSSYQWEHSLADEGSKGLYVWHENDFKIEYIIVDYYRKPLEIHFPSMSANKEYIDRNGVRQTKDQGLELSNMYARRHIIDIADLIGRANLGDTRDYEIKLNKIINVEKLN